ADPASDLLGRFQRADDLRGDRDPAAGELRARSCAAPGRAPARRGCDASQSGHHAADHAAAAGVDHARPRSRAGRARAGRGCRRQWRLAVAEEAVMKGPVLILAGGTGGHIFPGLSVAAALQARGVPVSWLGADGGMETRLVPQHGIAIDTIAVKGLRGKGIATLLAAPFRVAAAVFAAMRVIGARQPRAVVSFGGYAAGPGGIAARLRGVPLVVHEQNRAAGMTNRVLARFARRAGS